MTAIASQTDWKALEKKARISRIIFLAGLIGFLSLVSAPVVLPYIWLVVKSLTPDDNVVGHMVLWRTALIAFLAYFGAIAIALLPERFGTGRRNGFILLAIVSAALLVFIAPYLTLRNYSFLLNRDIANSGTSRLDLLPSPWEAMGNSLIFAFAETVIVILVAAPATYALSRFAFAARQGFLRGLLMLHAFPGLALTVALFVQLYYMGLLDTLLGVILIMSALELPFAILILKSFFDAVPWDTEMSAVTDGATRFQAFRMVVLPQVKSGLIAVATFTFLRGWEEYVFVKTMLIGSERMTMSLYLAFLSQTTMDVNYGMVAAFGVFYIAPVLAIYVFTQKHINQMNFGGIKG